jgi:outer membrane immunogenic protein
MTRRFAYFAIVLPLVSASAAHADGGRAEIHGGYEQLDYDSFFNPADSSFRPIKGAIYGIGIGYDVPLGDKAFAGIEGNADFSSESRCQVNPLILAPGIFENCLEPGRDLSANVRIGVKLGSGNIRVYGLAGYSNLRLERSSRGNGVPITGTTAQKRDSVRAGIGLEQNFGGRFYGKAEYRYSDYGSNIRRNQGLIGIGLRF